MKVMVFENVIHWYTYNYLESNIILNICFPFNANLNVPLQMCKYIPRDTRTLV